MKWQIDIDVNEQTADVSMMANVLKILADQLAGGCGGLTAKDLSSDAPDRTKGQDEWVISEAGPEAHAGTCVMRMVLTTAPFDPKTRSAPEEMTHVGVNISTGETRKVDTPKRH